MGIWNSQAEVENIKKRYTAGTRIELDYMDKENMPAGLKGIVDHVDDQGQLHMIWENGRSLALIPGLDSFHVLPQPKQEHMDTALEDEMER